MDGQVKEWVWAAGGLFGDEITVLVEGMYSVPQILDIYGNNTARCYSSATHLINTSNSSTPEDGHKVARNMLSNL